MSLLDIKGDIVNIGDRVLCSKYRKILELGRYEKTTRSSHIIRLDDKSSLSIPRQIWADNPAFDKAYYSSLLNGATNQWQLRQAYCQQIPSYILSENDKPNKCILKVDQGFSL